MAAKFEQPPKVSDVTIPLPDTTGLSFDIMPVIMHPYVIMIFGALLTALIVETLRGK